MIFRRILAGFFVFLFVVTALPTFFVYAFSKTFFNPDFYPGSVSDKVYVYLVDTVTINFYESDVTLQKHFQRDEVVQSVREAFTPELFRTIMADAGQQIGQLKLKPREPVTLSFKIFRDSLLTASHNLAYRLFQSIPGCKIEELPQVNEDGIPTCIPRTVDYVEVAGPLSKQFEKAVYGAFPEQVEIDLSSSKSQNKDLLISLFANIDRIKTYFLAGLLLISFFVVVLLYDSFSSILEYEGIAFFLSGICAFFISFLYGFMPDFLLQNFQKGTGGFSNLLGDQEHLREVVQYIFSFPRVETQKIALIFIALAVVFFVIRFFLRRPFLKNE